jgi:hypothetical protein
MAKKLIINMEPYPWIISTSEVTLTFLVLVKEGHLVATVSWMIFPQNGYLDFISALDIAYNIECFLTVDSADDLKHVAYQDTAIRIGASAFLNGTGELGRADHLDQDPCKRLVVGVGGQIWYAKLITVGYLHSEDTRNGLIDIRCEES